MSLLFNITVIFAVTTTASFTSSNAAAITGDFHLLPYPFDQGQIQQDPVPDPGIGDWFTNLFNGFSKFVANGLKDRDPKKIEGLKDYIKRMRTMVDPGIGFIRKYYSDDIAANNVINAADTFLSTLDKLVEGPSTSDKEKESLAKLMKVLAAVKS